MSQLGVGIIGCGYWGPNLVRNFSSCPRTQVVAVFDASRERLEKFRRSHCHLRLVNSFEEFLQTPGLQAVAIATPVSTHFTLAKQCLEAGLHVLVEKPLASTVKEADTLIHLAEQQNRVLMVDHTYLFGNAVRKIKELVDSDALGELYYVDSVRINLGLFQHDVNVIWDLAPHDLAIVEHVLGLHARSISAWGCAHAAANIEDIAYVNVDYGDRLLANFHVNWLSPVKVRQMIFAGARKSLIFNELNTTEPIKIYDRGINVDQSPEEMQRLMVSYRSGDVWSPHIEPGEALLGVANHFAECALDGVPCISGGDLGMRVVQLLEAATRSIRAQGGRVVLSNGNHTNGNGNARTGRQEQLHPDLPGRPAGPERGDPLLRELVRLSDRG